MQNTPENDINSITGPGITVPLLKLNIGVPLINNVTMPPFFVNVENVREHIIAKTENSYINDDK